MSAWSTSASSAEPTSAVTTSKFTAPAERGDVMLIATLLALAPMAEVDVEHTGDVRPSRAPHGAVAVEAGFSMIRTSYHRRLDSDLSIGGLIAFDYAYWAPDDAFGASLVLAVPLRYLASDTASYR